MSSIFWLLVVQWILLFYDKLMLWLIVVCFGLLLIYMVNVGMIEWEEIVESDVMISQL